MLNSAKSSNLFAVFLATVPSFVAKTVTILYVDVYAGLVSNPALNIFPNAVLKSIAPFTAIAPPTPAPTTVTLVPPAIATPVTV